jgi:hypothetical protein
MAELDFMDVADSIAYPFVYGDSLVTGLGLLPKTGVVDAGFIMGIDSEFVLGTHLVYLYGVTVTPTQIVFDIRSDAPGMAPYHFRFIFLKTDPFGCTLYTVPQLVSLLTPNPEMGYGFLTVGDLSELSALANGDYVLSTPARVEPALIQPLAKTYVRKIVVANTPRHCPAQCCETPAVDTVDAYVQTILTGPIKLREGHNCSLVTDTRANSIEIRGIIGAGEGVTCEDTLIDGMGIERGAGLCDDNCSSFISSINGVVADRGRLLITGASNVDVTPDQDNNKLVINIRAAQNCG